MSRGGQPDPSAEASRYLKATPWDERALGMPTYELLDTSETALRAVRKVNGHITARVDPLASTRLLHEHGFYYCDTLIVPFCRPGDLRRVEHPAISIRRDPAPEAMLGIGRGAFRFGRFHRDFAVPTARADLRYEKWLEDLLAEENVLGLYQDNEPAGFLAHREGHIVLHALSQAVRGKGLAKYFWSQACAVLFEAGYPELTSSISASNLAVLNLYASLGFRFREPRDLYHRTLPVGAGEKS